MIKRWMIAIGVSLGCGGAAFGQVTWDTAGSGNWEDVTNWSTGALPGVTDDVVIDQGGGFTITIDDSVPAIRSLMSVENLLFETDRDLTIENGGTVSGSFTLGTNSILTVNGGSFATTGPVTLDGGNVIANGGSNLDFSALTSYVTDTGTNSSRQLTANGGSSIDLSGVTDLTGGGFIRSVGVNANGGSSIDLSALTNYLGGATRINADGTGSSVDISSLGAFTNDGGVFGHLRAANGGTVNASSLTSISSIAGDRNRFIVDGSGSSINAAALTSVLNTRLQLTNGGTYDASGITDFTGSDALADSGVTLDLTGLTSYEVGTAGNESREVTSDGAGTIIDLSNVTTARAGGFIRRWNVAANNGGTVDLSGLTDITEGAANFLADGAGSLIDLSSLQNFNNDNGSVTSFLEATNGAEIRLSSDPASSLSFENVDISINGSGTLDTSRVVNFTQGIFTSDGVSRVLDLADATSSSFIANNGAQLDLTSLTGSLNNEATVNSLPPLVLRADGAGSLVDISNVTDLSTNGARVVGSVINIEAVAGGIVDLGSVTSLNSPGGIINSSRPINVLADGAGSQVDLSSAVVWSDVASVSNSSLQSLNGGNVDFGTGDLVLTNVDVTVDAGGTVNANSIELISVEISNTGDPGDDSILSGDGGTIVADILNTSGIVSPGNLGAGTLTIDGDYTQGIDGLLSLDIFDESTFDQLFVLGDAAFDGELLVTLDDGFDLDADTDFLVIDVGGLSVGNFENLTQGEIVLSDNGFDLRVDYTGGDGNDVVLTTAIIGVPEPSSMILISAAMFTLAVRRKRNR